MDFSNFKVGVNHRQNIAFMLQAPTAGANGWAIGLRELIINSVDAGGSNIRLALLPDGRFLIADDGCGMNAEAIASALSLGFSAKSRQDLTTAGANGTGQNICLGLGDMNKTKIEVVTSCDGKNFTSFVKNYEYFCLLTESKVTPQSRIKMSSVAPADWNKYLSRTSGTNVILSNCKLPSLTVIAQNFAQYLVPSVAEMVQVYDVKSRKLTPEIHDGEYFVVEESLGKFGKVNFELFVGSAKRSRIQVCGPTNSVMTLSALLERYSERPQELSTLSSCSGWIYLSDMTKWRLHDGSFSTDFFTQGAAKLFMELLLQIAKKVKDKLQRIQYEKASEEHAIILAEFVAANNLEFKNPRAGTTGGVLRNAPGARKELEVQIVPNQVYLQPNQVVTFVFENQGSLHLDPARWIADDANSPAKIKGKRIGNVLEIESNDRNAMGYITLTHPDLHATRSYSIKVVVAPRAEPTIVGPVRVQSGREIFYKLLHFDNETKVSWSLKEKDQDITVRTSGKRIGTFLSKVSQRKKTVILCVYDQLHGRKIADKEIEVFPPVQDGDLCITVCGQQFQLQPTPFLVGGPLAHMGSDYGDLPVIALNFNATSLAAMPNKKQQLLNSIVTVGMSWLVQKNKLNALEMPTVLEEFLERMNKRMRMS